MAKKFEELTKNFSSKRKAKVAQRVKELKAQDAKRPNFSLVRDENKDWQALFIDGKIYTQTTSIDIYTVLDRLEEMGLITFEVYEANLQFKEPTYWDTIEKNTAAGIIDEPEPR